MNRYHSNSSELIPPEPANQGTHSLLMKLLNQNIEVAEKINDIMQEVKKMENNRNDVLKTINKLEYENNRIISNQEHIFKHFHAVNESSKLINDKVESINDDVKHNAFKLSNPIQSLHCQELGKYPPMTSLKSQQSQSKGSPQIPCSKCDFKAYTGSHLKKHMKVRHYEDNKLLFIGDSVIMNLNLRVLEVKPKPLLLP